MKTIKGRIAVVTGAGGGIGRATSLALAGRGCHLALVDVKPDGLAETQTAVEALGVNATVHLADVSNPDRMAELPDEVTGAHGACHILVNNAGVLSVGRFEEDKLDDIRWIIGINIFGIVHGCHYFLPVLRQADEAHIVNVSSMAAFAGIPQNAVYSLTKGAVRSFTEALRAELVGTNVGASTLFPGSTNTNIMPRIPRRPGRPPQHARRQVDRAPLQQLTRSRGTQDRPRHRAQAGTCPPRARRPSHRPQRPHPPRADRPAGTRASTSSPDRAIVNGRRPSGGSEGRDATATDGRWLCPSTVTPCRILSSSSSGGRLRCRPDRALRRT